MNEVWITAPPYTYVLVDSCGIIEKLVDIAKCLQVEQYSVTVNALLSKRESRD